MRVCKRCHCSKPVEQFPQRTSSHSTKNICTDCRDKRVAEWYSKNASTKEITEKRCGYCEAVKPVSEFMRRRWSQDGVSATCRKCTLELNLQKAGSKLVAEKICPTCRTLKKASEFGFKALAVDHLSRNCKDCQRWYVIKSKYGIGKREYELLFQSQDGKCAICKRPSVEPLAVDHCHGSLRVRGLLCDKCNKGLGQFEDNTAFMLNAISYIDMNRSKQ